MAERQKKKAVTLVVGPFRMAFPALFEPEQTDNGERYKMTMLFPPNSPDVPKIEDALYDCMEDAFGPKADWPNGRNDVHPSDKFYDAGKNKKYNGFIDGWMALPISAQEAPGIVDADRNEVLSKREVYGGRWARAQIVVTSYDNKSKGVTAYLNHVQLLDHDEAFSGRGRAEDAFDKYELKDRGREKSRDDDTRSSRDERGRDREDTRNDRRDNSRGREPERSSRNDRDRDDRPRDRGSEDRGRDNRDRDGRGREDDRGRDNDRDRSRDDRPSRSREDDRGRDRGRDDERSRSSSRRDDDWN